MTGTKEIVGWLLAGCGAPEGRGLMLGLGLGIGPVMLLHHFERLHLVAVELDPAVIELSLKHFPLLRMFCDQGRIELLQEDAREFIDRSRERFDFTVLDLHNGWEGNPEVIDERLLASLCERSEAIWANLIGSKDSPWIAEFIRTCERIGCPTRVMSQSSHHWKVPISRNWLVTMHDQSAPDLSGFTPYKDADGEHVMMLRRQLRNLLDSAESPRCVFG